MPKGEKGFPHPTEEDEVLPGVPPENEFDDDLEKEKISHESDTGAKSEIPSK